MQLHVVLTNWCRLILAIAADKATEVKYVLQGKICPKICPAKKHLLLSRSQSQTGISVIFARNILWSI